MSAAPLPRQPSVVERILGLFLSINPGEGVRVLVMFAYFTLVMITYYLVKPATRALMMETWGAGNLPMGNLTTALVIAFSVMLFDYLAARYRRHHLVAIMTGLAVGAVLLIWGGFRVVTSPDWRKGLALGYFVYADIYSVMGTTLFWAFCHDFFTPAEGKRLYGFIGAGGAVGGIIGGLVSGAYAKSLGAGNLQLLSIVPLGLTVALAWLISTSTEARAMEAQSVGPAGEKKPAGGGLDGLRLIGDSSYLQSITGLVSIILVGSLVIETQFNMTIEKEITGTNERAAFMGNRDAQLNVIQFLSQTLLTAPMVRWFGLRGVLLVLPIGDLLMGLAYFTTPTLTIANYAKIFDGSMKYGTNQVTKEMLYLPTPTAVKYQAKAFIDVFFHRVAKGLSAAILLVFTQALGFSAPALFYPLIVFVAIWVWLVVRIERLYRHNLQGRLLAEFGPQSTAHGGANLGDPAHALARLEQHFGAEVLDPNAVRLALIDHLRNHPLHEPSATAAAHALVLGGREQRALAIEWLQITVAPQFAPLLAALRDLPLDPSGRRRLFNQCVPATVADT